MIVIILVLLVGIGCGAVLADRLFQAGVTKASKRALEQLEYTLDGLETAYSMKAALLAAHRDFFVRLPVPDGPYDPDKVVHLPRHG